MRLTGSGGLRGSGALRLRWARAWKWGDVGLRDGVGTHTRSKRGSASRGEGGLRRAAVRPGEGMALESAGSGLSASDRPLEGRDRI